MFYVMLFYSMHILILLYCVARLMLTVLYLNRYDMFCEELFNSFKLHILTVLYSSIYLTSIPYNEYVNTFLRIYLNNVR